MDLRSGETVWRLKNGPPHLFPPLSENVECDIAIVGGGISGALISRELVKAGLHCVLIDKREPGAGSTSASTALLLYELDTPLWKLAEKIGEEKAAASYKACVEAVGKIESLVKELCDPSDFIPRKSFYFAAGAGDAPDLEREWKARSRHGIPVELFKKAEIESLFSFSREAALLSPHAAEIDVVRFVDALLAAARAGGLRLYGNTTMVSCLAEPGHAVLHTDTGHRITARKVVFATGYESGKYLGRKIGSLKSTYAIATTPLADFPGWHDRSLIWESGTPYLYLRTTGDNRAVIGGGDIDFQNDKIRDALLPGKTVTLEKKLRELFPAMEFETACAWTGTFGETDDSLPYIGHPPDRPNIYFAMGYGGNGITFSMIAAEIIRDACLGLQHPAASLFDLER